MDAPTGSHDVMFCRQVTELIYKQRIFRITGLDFKATSNNGNCINANKFRTGSLCLFLQFWNDHRFNPTSIEWEDRGQRLLPRIFSAHLAFGVDLPWIQGVAWLMLSRRVWKIKASDEAGSWGLMQFSRETMGGSGNRRSCGLTSSLPRCSG